MPEWNAVLSLAGVCFLPWYRQPDSEKSSSIDRLANYPSLFGSGHLKAVRNAGYIGLPVFPEIRRGRAGRIYVSVGVRGAFGALASLGFHP